MRYLLLTNIGWLVALFGLLVSIPLGKRTIEREQEENRRQSSI
jgi:hypothetical protein